MSLKWIFCDTKYIILKIITNDCFIYQAKEKVLNNTLVNINFFCSVKEIWKFSIVIPVHF